jgi:hypothetical protein
MWGAHMGHTTRASAWGCTGGTAGSCFATLPSRDLQPPCAPHHTPQLAVRSFDTICIQVIAPLSNTIH